jgi:hypothetical protein
MIRKIQDKLYVSENYFKLLMSTRGYESFVHHFISVTYVKVPELGSDELFCDIGLIEPQEVRELIRADIESIAEIYSKYSTGSVK